jgi:serine/threonine-protein kinase RsbW
VSAWAMIFEGLPERVSDVRRFTENVLGDVPGVDGAVLIASELAANAIRHSRSGNPDGIFALHLTDFDGRWRICVYDEGGPNTPRAGHPDDSEESGLGLLLVAAVSRAWGVLGNRDGRAVWAEVAR